MGRLIGEGHEYRYLCYFGISPHVCCFTFLSFKLLHDHLGHPHLLKKKKWL